METLFGLAFFLSGISMGEYKSALSFLHLLLPVSSQNHGKNVVCLTFYRCGSPLVASGFYFLH